MKENSTNKSGEKCQGQMNKQILRKQNSSHLPMIDWHSNLVNANKKPAYPSGWRRRKLTWSRKTLHKTTPSNCRPRMCLPTMWKILTSWIKEELYFSLACHRLFPEEQKGCCRGARETDNQPHIEQHIFKESKPGSKCNYGTYWPKWPLISSYKLGYWMFENIQNIRKSHKLYHESHEKLERGIGSRRTDSSKGENLDRRLPENLASAIFIARILLNYILRKYTEGYKSTKSQEKINQLM